MTIVVCSSTSHSTTCCRISSRRDLIAVDAEVCNVGGVLSHCERVGQVGRDHLAVLRPVAESVALVGCHRQRAARSVCVSACACDDTGFNRVDRRRDLVAVDAEVGNVGGVLSHRERVGQVGRDHLAVLSPVAERVALVGGHRQRAARSVCVRACARDASGFARVDRGSDLVAVEAKVGNILSIFSDRKAINGVC